MMGWERRWMIGCNNARGGNAILDVAETWLRGKELGRRCGVLYVLDTKCEFRFRWQ